MSDTNYQPPKIWKWEKNNGGSWASTNRPTSGATHEKILPSGDHDFQLYSLATPNGVKVTIMFEELLEKGHAQANYDAWLIDISEGDQFSSGFVEINPNSKIPALLDRSGREPVHVFESASILMHLAEKFGDFLPAKGPDRTKTTKLAFLADGKRTLFRGRFLVTSTPMPLIKSNIALIRFAMEVKRQLDVLDKELAKKPYLAGDFYSIADIAVFPWYGALVQGLIYDAAEFLQVESYKNVVRWATDIAKRPAVKRGRMVNKSWGAPEAQLRNRHSADDFNTSTWDKIGNDTAPD